MKMQTLIRLAILIALALSFLSRGLADQPEDEAAIRQLAVTYVDAFNRQDAKAIASLWSPDAVYANPVSGTEVVGREAIEQELAAIFADGKGTTLEVTVNSVQFVSPNVAVEQGTARVVRPGADADVTVYSAVHVKRDGKWMLDRMSEEPSTAAPSSYEHLKDLEWMIGKWIDQDDQAAVETNAQWTKNHTFISRTFSVSVGDQIELSGIQLIGWDPVTNRIRSWVFDSDGGFGEATWTHRENRWTINAHSTLPDGRKASAINVMTIIDPNTITWQASGRSVGDEILPNIEPIKITRASQSE